MPDCSGNGLTGTVGGAVIEPGTIGGGNAVVIGGKVGEALGFSAPSSSTGPYAYVAIPESAGLELSHDVTLAAWVQTTVTPVPQKENFLSKYDLRARRRATCCSFCLPAWSIFTWAATTCPPAAAT